MRERDVQAHLPEVDIDFQGAATLVDPYVVYEQVRALGRLVRNRRTGALLVTGYDDCAAAFRSTESLSSSAIPDRIDPDFPPMPSLISSDPPFHGRLRMALRPLFAPRAIRSRDEHARRVLADLVRTARTRERIRAGEAVPIVDDVIAPFTVRTIMHLLGVAERDTEWFARRAWALIDFSGARVADTRAEMPTADVAARAWDELAHYYADRLARARGRRAERDIFLTTRLLQRLSDDEIFSSAQLILLAGADSTIKFVSSALMLMAQHPEAQALLRQEPGLRAGGLEEMLRFAGPTQFDPRLVTAPTSIADRTVPAGETVWLMTAAANRDPAVFDRPEELDVTRSPRPHLAFGHGIHLCLGAPVARMVARATLDHVLDELPPLRIQRADYGRGMFVRGPIELDVAALDGASCPTDHVSMR